VIINRACGCNVYRNVIKDYTGNDVTPENFMNVLMGISVGGKKVLKSDSDDHVFIYFTDHGSTNLIAFPDEYMYADQLNSTLWYMYQKKMYGKMTFYLESCESGSMFDGYLDPKMNIWAATASTPDESSYACEYVPEVNAMVGDCWSMVWLENSKLIRVHRESLEDQFRIMMYKTVMSTPCKYGNMDMRWMKLSEFMSASNHTDGGESDCYCYSDGGSRDAVSSRDVALEVAIRSGNAEKIKEELDSRSFYDDLFSWCDLDELDFDTKLVNMDNYRELINDHVKQYGRFSDYGLKYAKCLAALCVDCNVDE
jgi:hypothetical protein